MALSTFAIGFSLHVLHSLIQSLILMSRSGNSSFNLRTTFPLPLLFSQNRIFMSDHHRRAWGNDENALPHFTINHQDSVTIITHQLELGNQVAVIVFLFNLLGYEPL